MAALVTQCGRGSYHVNTEFGVVEIVANGEPVEPGNQGEIVATGFINPVMPLIRYATGDQAIAATTPCTCGRASPVIQEILGRTDDVVITPDGRRVGRLSPIFHAVKSLYETRIIQDRRDHLRVEVVPTGTLEAGEERALMRALRDRVGDTMEIDIVRRSHIPREASGKLRTVINKCLSDDCADG